MTVINLLRNAQDKSTDRFVIYLIDMTILAVRNDRKPINDKRAISSAIDRS